MKFGKLTVLALVTCVACTACGNAGGAVNNEPVAQATAAVEPGEVQATADVEPGEVQATAAVEPGDVQEPTADTNNVVAYLTAGTVGDYTYEVEPDFTDGRKYYLDDLKKRCWFADSLEEENSPIWVVISSGEKSHGGYGIGVVDITEEDGTVVITVEETSPDPDEATTEAIETPNVTVRFDYGTAGTPKDIKGVNTEGVEIPCAY